MSSRPVREPHHDMMTSDMQPLLRYGVHIARVGWLAQTDLEGDVALSGVMHGCGGGGSSTAL